MNTHRLTGILLSIILFASSVSAQDDKYNAAMKQCKENIAKVGNGETFQTVAAQYERIAQAEHNKWLPYYYASLYSVLQVFATTDNTLKDQILDHAQALMDSCLKQHPDSSEWNVVQGYLYIGRLMVDPIGRGAEFSRIATEAFDNAIALNPSNPRGYYMKGVFVLHTPDFYGGGKVPAKPILDKAVRMYESFKPAAPFFPDWGKDDCQKQLASCE